MKGMAYRFSLRFRPGVMNRHSSHSSTGEARNSPAVGGDLDPQGQPVEGPGDVEPAAAGRHLAVGVLEERQDPGVDQEGHGGGDDEGHGTDQHPASGAR